MARPDREEMDIEVVYAEPHRQIVIALTVGWGATVADAIARSGITAQVPDALQRKLGVFSRKVTAATLLHDGDRVEIYRALLADPKEARRKRAVPRRQGNRR